jgi:hypothetical protein
MNWEHLCLVLTRRRIGSVSGIGMDSDEERLSSFIKPRSMLYIEHQTQVQFVAETNESKVYPAWRFEVSKVEAL